MTRKPSFANLRGHGAAPAPAPAVPPAAVDAPAITSGEPLYGITSDVAIPAGDVPEGLPAAPAGGVGGA